MNRRFNVAETLGLNRRNSNGGASRTTGPKSNGGASRSKRERTRSARIEQLEERALLAVLASELATGEEFAAEVAELTERELSTLDLTELNAADMSAATALLNSLAPSSSTVSYGPNASCVVQIDPTLSPPPSVVAFGTEAIDVDGETVSGQTYVVTTALDVVDPDDGVTSLREAASLATSLDTITFAPSLKGETILLSGSQIEITTGITIDASALYDEATGTPRITIDANKNSRAFYISGGTADDPATLIGLTITNGYAADAGGGAIYVAGKGALSVENSTFTANAAGRDGGAIYVYEKGALSVNNSTFTENTARHAYGGGAIYVYKGTLNVENSTFTGNSAYGDGQIDGGAIGVYEGTLNVENSTFTGNSAYYGGAIYLESCVGSNRIASSVFDGNTGSWGGAIYAKYNRSTVFDDLTVKNNTAPSGGGVYLEGSGHALTNSTFTDNVAKGFGGAINCSGSTLSNITATGNVSNNRGGAIYCDGSTLSDITATDNVAERGGAIYVAYTGDGGAKTTLSDLTATGNVAEYGGAIYNVGKLTASNFRIEQNQCKDVSAATGAVACGGGIYNGGFGDLTLTSGAIVGNVAEAVYAGTSTSYSTYAYGGGIYNYATLTATNVTLAGNEARYSNVEGAKGVGASGGGIYNEVDDYGSSMLLRNVLVVDNKAETGGGIYGKANSTVANATIARNVASKRGGGVYVASENKFGLYNSIIAENVSEIGDGSDVYVAEKGQTAFCVSLIGDASSLTGKPVESHRYSLLGTAADPLSPGFVDSANGDYSLAAGSPAIDAGLAYWELAETDLVGNARLQGTRLDLGAYEFVQADFAAETETPSTVVTTALDVVDPYDGLISLREAIEYAESGATVSFDADVFAEKTTIELAGLELYIDKDLTITAPEVGVVLDAKKLSRIATAYANVRFENFEFRNGYSYSYGVRHGDGGAIYVPENGALSVKDSTFTGNSAGHGDGGAIGVYKGTLNVENSTFTGNVAGGDGGAIYLDDGVGSNRIVSSVFDGNTSGNDGGAIYVSGGKSAVLDDLEVKNNTAARYGGGVRLFSGNHTLTNSTFTDNVASFGGAIYCDDSTLSNITATGNVANNRGGAIYNGGTSKASNFRIEQNQSKKVDDSSVSVYGGGIYNSGTLTLTSGAIVGNVAEAVYTGTSTSYKTYAYGGGIYNSGKLTATNVTLAGNEARYSNVEGAKYVGAYGGGLYNASSSYTSTLRNVIIAENYAQTAGSDVYLKSGTLDASRTLSTYEFENADENYAYDPNAPLFADVDAGDCRLAPNSQAIDKGDDQYAYDAGLTVDSRDLAGRPRFVGDSIDLGAYEASGVKLSQSGAYAGDVLVEWTPIQNAVSVRLAWSTETATRLLGVFDATGEFVWDTTRHADGPGALQVEFLDADGAAIEVVDVDGFILNAGNIYVDTTSVAVDGFDGKISLLEAIDYVEKLRIAAPIKFAPELAGKTIVVNDALVLTSASFDGGDTGVVLDVESLTIARRKFSPSTVALQNISVKTGRLDVECDLNLVDSSVALVKKDGVAPTLGGSGQAVFENVEFSGDASIWTVDDSFVFRNATFDGDVLLASGSILAVQTQATINATVTIGDDSSKTTVRLDGDATLAGVGALRFGGSAKSLLQILGTDEDQAVLTVANGLTLRGLGKIDGTNFAVVCDGTFEPRGEFALNGDFTLGIEGRLVFGVSALKDYATLTVSGDATLLGTVELAKLRFDFVPTTLNSFKFLKAKTLEVDENVWYEGTTFGDYAELTPEIASDSLIFTVGYVSGPKVVAIAPIDASASGSSAPYLDVYFDQSVDVATFTVDDISILDAEGKPVSFKAPSSLNRADNAFRIYFDANDYRDGTYSITIGPDVRNPLGTLMNQDGSPPNGGEEDAFAGSFVFAAPNLQVAFDEESFPKSGFLGQKLAVAIATENVGVADALGSWRNRIYLSKDQTLSNDDYLLTTYSDGVDSRFATALEAGERKLRVAQCSLPLDNRTWVEGDYYLIVVSDVDNRVFESNNKDNQAVSGKISLVYPELADLTVVSVDAPKEATAGETVEIIWTTKNEGERAATESWRESVYISPTGSLVDATLLKTLYVGEDLGSGDAIQRRANVVIPSEGFVGSACFIVVCDSSDNVLEENDDNNSSVSAPATVLRQKLTLSSATQVSEGERLRVVLSRTGDVSQEATATLTVGDSTELDVPGEVVFARGQSSVAFYVSAIKDGEFDDDQWTTLAATLDGYDGASRDLCVVNIDKAALTLDLSSEIGNEGDELTLTVSRNYVVDAPLVVKLTASPSKQLKTPTSVTIPANESSATVTIYVVDDDVPESETNVQIRATSLQFIADSKVLTVVDDDEPSIALTFVESTVQEGIGANAAVGVVSRAEAASAPLRVRLTSSRPDKILVPKEVTIPAGKTSVEFSVASLDNGVVDGEVEVTISASGVLENCNCSSPTDSTGYATATLISLDDDGPKLTLTLDNVIIEEGGKGATLTVKRNTATTEPLTVSLASSDETEIALPETVVIPVGQSSVSIAIAALDDSEVDEDQWVTLEARADGFTRGSALALVTDASAPDLRVAAISTPSSSVEMGSTIEVAYRVENQGTIPAAVENGSWIEKVWFSHSSAITSSSTLLATFERSEPLSYESGANAYERTLSVDIPSAIGTYYIIVQLDTENAVYESIEANNSFVSNAIKAVYTPKYGAVVQTDVEKADPATPIPMYGYAYNLETGERAPNVEVEVFVVTKYGTRSFGVTTDENGAFETTWTPLSTESGAYTIGAAHPWYSSAPAQDKFSLMKMSAGFTRGSFSIVEKGTASGSFRVYNESSEPITGLTCDIEGLAENIELDVKFSSSTIPAGGSVEVTLTAKALNATIPTSSAKIRVSCAETNPISGSLTFDIYRENPYLTCDVQKISGSMTRGEQKFVEFTICNESGVESGPVELALPDVDWMLPVGGATLPSLAPGEARTVKLLLNPSEDMELTVYRGSFGINYANTGIKVDYQYRLRADAFGELRVLAVDEYYYHSEEQPTLSGASVKVVDSVTKQVAATGTTASDGALTIRQLPEGYYDVYVSASNHNNYSKTIYIEAGENELEALLTKQTVRYEWTVTPTTIEDEYEITIETVYEVNVPAPVVTIDPPQMDLSDLLEVGQRKQINFTLTNHGLIAAHDVAPFFEDHPELKFTPLTQIVDELPAKSSCVIPVIIERVAPSSGSSAVEAEEASDAESNVGEAVEKRPGIQMNSVSFVDERAARRKEALAASSATTNRLKEEIAAALPRGSRAKLSDCSVNASFSHRWLCAGEQQAVTPVGVRTPKNFICSTDSSFSPPSPYFLGVGLGGGYSSPGSVGGGGYSWGGGSSSAGGGAYMGTNLQTSVVPIVPKTETSCEDCKTAIGGALGSCLTGFIPGSGAVSCGGGVFDFMSSAGKSDPDDPVAFSLNVASFVGAGLSCLGREIPVAGDLVFCAVGVAQAINDNRDGCQKLWNDLQDKVTQVLKRVSGSSNAVLESATARAASVQDYETSLLGDMFGAYLNMSDAHAWFTEILGSDSNSNLLNKNSAENFSAFLTRFGEMLQNGDGVITDAEKAELIAEPLPEGATQGDVVAFIGRWNRTMDYYSRGIFGEADVPEGESIDFIDLNRFKEKCALGAEKEAEAKAQGAQSTIDAFVTARQKTVDYLNNETKSGVCAGASIRLKQTAVLTRDAFDAQLVLSNDTGYELQDVNVDMVIYDSFGNDVTSLFGVYPPTAEGFYSASADDLGNLGAKSQGVANWIFVPSTECAKDGPEVYSVGGILTYIEKGQTVTVNMAPVSITVAPQPELDLVYFWQRDALADDPWTEEVEESVPFELAVMAVNKGNGEAKNLRIISAQPEIVENEKGLLIDFEIVGSQVNGKDASESLTVNLGNIAPGGTSIGQWFMTTTVQGHFVDYRASFKHVNGFGDLQFSLIKNVEIHELIRSVLDDSLLADELPDFLVNDVADPIDAPDTLYLSTGEIESVATATEFGVVGELSGRESSVELNVVSADAGWNYIQLRDGDPGGSEYELLEVARSDGKVLNAKNFWQTDRFFPDGRETLFENTLHILDYFETGGETYTYELRYRIEDETPPTLLSVEGPASDVVALPLERVALVFDEPIDAQTLTPENITLTREGGRNLIDDSVSIEQISETRFEIVGLSALTKNDGVYELTVSLDGVADMYENVAANVSQTLTWTNSSASPYVVSIDRPAERAPDVVDSIRVELSQPVDASSFTVSDWTLTRDGGENLLAAATDVELTAESATVWRISGLSGLTALDGEYRLTLKTNGLRSVDAKRGVGEETVVWTKDVAGLSRAVWSGVLRETTNFSYDALYLGFDEAVDFASLDFADFTLTRDGEEVALNSSLTLGILPRELQTTDAAQEWKLVGLKNFASLDGTYVLTVSLEGVCDEAGNFGNGAFSTTWTVDSAIPSIVVGGEDDEPKGAPLANGASPLANVEGEATTLGAIRTSSSEVVLSGRLSKPNMVVRVYDALIGAELAAFTTSSADFTATVEIPQEGRHELLIRATDMAGNWIDCYQTVYVDKTAPFVESVEVGSIRQGDAANFVKIKFSEVVDVQRFIDDGTIGDVVALTLETTGAALELPASAFEYDATSRTLRVDLNGVDAGTLDDALNVEGSTASVALPLALTIDSDVVRDAAGNMLRGVAAAGVSALPLRFARATKIATSDGVELSASGTYSVPSLADWNGDGALDLIVGEKSADGSGRVAIYLNEGTNAEPVYSTARRAQYVDDESGETREIVVAAKPCLGAAPRAVDFNGDGALDLFVGLGDGQVLYYQGVGTGDDWRLGAPTFVEYGPAGMKTTLDVGDRAVLEICDWNGDGRNDLLVGAADGKFYLLVDAASQGDFDFATLTTLSNASGPLVVESGRSAPTLADVNGDGVKDLVSGSTNGRLFAFLNVGSTFAPVWSESVELSGVDGALDLEGTQRSRPFACDYDGDGATDLLVGASDGAVRYFRGLRSVALDASGVPGETFVYSVDWVAGNVYLTAELGNVEYVVQEDCALNVEAQTGEGLTHWWDLGGSATVDAKNFEEGGASLWVDASGLDVDENGATAIRVLVKDGKSASAPATATVRVERVAPTVSVVKSTFANGQALRLNFEAFFPNGRTGAEWTLDWGDGTEPETFRNLGDAFAAAHVYAAAPETRTYVATLTLVDNRGFGGETSFVVAEHVVSAEEKGESSISTSSLAAEETASFDGVEFGAASEVAVGVLERSAFNVNAYGDYATTQPTARPLAERARTFAEALRDEFEEDWDERRDAEFDALAAAVLEANERSNAVDPFEAAFAWAFDDEDDEKVSRFDF